MQSVFLTLPRQEIAQLLLYEGVPAGSKGFLHTLLRITRTVSMSTDHLLASLLYAVQRQSSLGPSRKSDRCEH